MYETTMALMQVHLQAAVPLLIAEIKQAGQDAWAGNLPAVQRLGQQLGEKGDRLLHRGSTQGETAGLVSDLACGIAHLAFLPGGITTFGLHFEATFDEGESLFGTCHWDLREANRHTWPDRAKESRPAAYPDLVIPETVHDVP